MSVSLCVFVSAYIYMCVSICLLGCLCDCVCACVSVCIIYGHVYVLRLLCMYLSYLSVSGVCDKYVMGPAGLHLIAEAEKSQGVLKCGCALGEGAQGLALKHTCFVFVFFFSSALGIPPPHPQLHRLAHS